MKKVLYFAFLLLICSSCSKEDDNTDYAKLIIGKYKTKTLNSNGMNVVIPDSVQAYHIITYSSFNKIDFKQDFPNGASTLYGINVEKYNLSASLTDSKFVGSISGNTLNFTLTLNTGQYVSAVSVK